MNTKDMESIADILETVELAKRYCFHDTIVSCEHFLKATIAKLEELQKQAAPDKAGEDKG